MDQLWILSRTFNRSDVTFKHESEAISKIIKFLEDSKCTMKIADDLFKLLLDIFPGVVDEFESEC